MIPRWTSHEVKFEAAWQEGTLDGVVIGALLRETERESNGFRTKFIYNCLQLLFFTPILRPRKPTCQRVGREEVRGMYGRSIQ